MPGSFTQGHRFLSLTTPLGQDALLLSSFSVSERVSAPYVIELDVLSKTAVNPKNLLGQAVSFSLSYGDLEGGKRYFHGIVNEVGAGGETERFHNARIVAVPKLWLLTLSQRFRVFEQMTVPDIVKKLLQEYGIQTRWDIKGTYLKWDFCFQYRESDFNFVSRLLEHEGIFYFFEHAAGSHTMVLADSPSAFKPCPDQPTASYGPAEGIGPSGADFVTTWEQSAALRTGHYGMWDYDFEHAANPIGVTVNTAAPIAGNTGYKSFDFPSRTVLPLNKIHSRSAVSELTRINRVRMEEIETENPVFRGNSNCRAFSTGQRFALRGGDLAGEYAITNLDHTGSQYPPYISGMESAVLYTNSMSAVKYGSPFRPPRMAQRSLVHGPQTAVVSEGPDKYGRMRVKFFWGDQVASGWVRVAQRWAGPQWGSIFLPRIGHEVVLDFLDGDPDHPLIIGSVYNSQNMPPYPLPDKYTQSGIKTRSMTANGGAEGGSDEFNELRFEDLQGKEDIYFHAQKDFHRVVENDDDLKVGHDQTIEVKNHRTETVKDGNEKVTIEKGKREIFVDTGNDLHQVKMGNRDAVIDMGNDTIEIKMGNHTRKINLGKSETEAMQSITLKVGANSIKIDQTGITLDGIMINFKGQAMIKSQAPMQQMNGDALVKIQGGITMIN